MRRIHVTGNAGVGKSTLAARVGVLLDLPVFGLDEIVWKPGWRKAEPRERGPKERALCDRPSWVIDGVSRMVREAAEMVIFLDYPRRVSFWRCAKRNWRYLFQSRPGLPEKCPEIRIVPALAGMIWRFPTKVRPSLLAHLEECGDRKIIVHVRSDRDLRILLQGLEGNSPRSTPSALTMLSIRR